MPAGTFTMMADSSSRVGAILACCKAAAWLESSFQLSFAIKSAPWLLRISRVGSANAPMYHPSIAERQQLYG